MTSPIPSPTSVLQQINIPGLYAGTINPVQGLSGLCYFSLSGAPPFLPSNVTEIIAMTGTAFLASNVEIGGNLQVDGQFSTGVAGTLTSTVLNINPGPLTVVGSASSFALFTITNLASNPAVPPSELITAAAGDRAFGIQVAGDGFSRLRIHSDGSMFWGGGTATGDVEMFRSTVGTLTIQPAGAATVPTLPGGLVVTGAGSVASLMAVTNTQTSPNFPALSVNTVTVGDRAIGVEVTGDTNHRIAIDSGGTISWGSGSATRDVQLSRTSAGYLTIQPTATRNGGLNLVAAGSTNSLLSITNTASAPTVPPTQWVAAASGDRVWGVSVNADGFQRLRTDSTGLFQWGPGNTTQDTNLYRIGAGTLRTDNNFSVGGTISGGMNTLAANIQPDGVGSAGSIGIPADAGHIHPEHAQQSLYIAPTGATGETVPRAHCNVNAGTITSGAAYLRAIPLPAGLLVSTISFNIGTTAANGVTHGWYAITDANRIVKAVTADQGTTTIWGTASSTISLNVVSPYTTANSGLHYLAISITATTTPTLTATGNLSGGLAGNVPVLYGTSGTVTTPPTVGTTLSALSSQNGFNIYGYTS